MTKQFTRRSFLAGGAAASALAFAGLTGCSPAAPASEEPQSSTDTHGTKDLYALEPVGEPSETISADVVVIGAGGSGLATAIAAAQEGLKVIVLEKTGDVGGSYGCTEGMHVINCHYQLEQGIEYDAADRIQAVLDYHHWVVNPALYNTFVSEMPATVDWCDSIGMKFTGLTTIGKNENCVLVWHHEKDDTSAGASTVRFLHDAAEREGVEFMLQTPAKKIAMEDGKVTGVIAQKADGTVIKVEAASAVFATGGFGSNPEMMKELAFFEVTPVDLGKPGRDGDGLRMALDAGAKLWAYPGTTTVNGPSPLGATWHSLPNLMCISPLVWLNQDAKRFVREDYSNFNFSFAGNAAKAQQRLLVVFSQADLDHYENVGPYQQLMTVFFEDTPMTGLTEQLMELKDLGSLYQGETLAELAQAASLDPKQLEETISTYNESCKKGFDEEYGKPAKYLHALEEGPFYALECGALYYGTGGTMKVTTKCECVDDEFNVVPGLYAVGTDAGGLLGDSYDGNEMPCSMSAWVLNSGRIAARNIAEYLNK